jgi:hypothetical protein
MIHTPSWRLSDLMIRLEKPPLDRAELDDHVIELTPGSIGVARLVRRVDRVPIGVARMAERTCVFGETSRRPGESSWLCCEGELTRLES